MKSTSISTSLSDCQNTVTTHTSAMSSRRTKRARSQSPPPFNRNNLTTKEKDAIELLKVNCFETVLCNEDTEDANTFTDAQLVYIRDKESARYDGMDFVHLSDERIGSIVLSKYANPPAEIPFSVWRNSSKIRKYANRMANSAHGRNAAQNKSLEALHVIANTIHTKKVESVCLGISLSSILANAGHSSKDEYEEKVEAGFKVLVRITLRNKAEELKKADAKEKGHKVRIDLLRTDGFILDNDEDKISNVFAILKLNINRADVDRKYNF